MKIAWALLIAVTCGIPPIPPVPSVGCKRMDPVCICDSDGNCEWQFVCVSEYDY